MTVAYTSRQLIIDAYYLSGIVGRNYEFTTGDEINDGLDRLNDFLQIKGSETKLIQYYDKIEDNFVIGQEKYFIPNLVEIDTFTFFLTNPYQSAATTVRFQMENLSRQEYFAYPRAEGVEALPYTWHLERCLGGANIYVYFLPIQPYLYQLTGKFALTNTALNQDLNQIYDGWYQTYLKYGLAIWLCEWRSVVPPASVVKTFEQMEQSLSTLSPFDFTMRKLEYFRSSAGLSWADVNYGKGWRSHS
jgi:hypothetical protein